MEAVAIQKFIHSTPRKLRLVADMVRKTEPQKALEVLQFTHKAAALDLSKAIQVAVANAKQKGMENILFKSIEINEGPKMRRYRAGARGRVKPFKRRMAQIRIVLTDNLNVKSQSENLKVKEKQKGDETAVVVDDLADKANKKSKVRTKSVQK